MAFVFLFATSLNDLPLKGPWRPFQVCCYLFNGLVKGLGSSLKCCSYLLNCLLNGHVSLLAFLLVPV